MTSTPSPVSPTSRMSAAERVIRRAENERRLKELGDARENRDRRPVLPHPCDPEIARLRRLYLGPLAVFRFRRRARYLRLNERTTMPRPAGPAELAQLLVERSKHLRQWPEDVLRDVCADAREHIGFAGEIVCHEGEWWHSHRVIVLLEGTLGVAQPDAAPLTIDEAASAYGLLLEYMAAGRDSTANAVGLLQRTRPSSMHKAPAVLGEVTVLSQGAAPAAIRVISPTCRYVAVSAAKLHAALAAGRVPADAVAAAFGPEVVRAREAVLRQHFPQTEPLMKQCWVCEGMTSAEVHAVVAGLRPAVFLPGQDVVVQGDAAATMYFLRRGSAAVVIGGKPIPGVVVGAGKTFGEMGVLFREPRMATIRALSVVDTWELSKDALERIIRHSPVRATIAAKAASIRQGWISRVPRDVVPAALKKHSIMRHLPDTAIDELTKRAEARVFTPGQLLTMVARVTDEMLVVFGGTATAQDVTGRKFTKGDVIAPYALCPHRGYETVASSTMLDAFALSRTLLEEVLKKHGCYDKAMRQLHGELEILSRSSSYPAMLVLSPEQLKSHKKVKLAPSSSSYDVLARLTVPPVISRAGRHAIDPLPLGFDCDSLPKLECTAAERIALTAQYFASPQWEEGAARMKDDPNFIEELAKLPSTEHLRYCMQRVRYADAIARVGGDPTRLPTRPSAVKYSRFGKPSDTNGSRSMSRSPGSTPTALRPMEGRGVALKVTAIASRASAVMSAPATCRATPVSMSRPSDQQKRRLSHTLAARRSSALALRSVNIAPGDDDDGEQYLPEPAAAPLAQLVTPRPPKDPLMHRGRLMPSLSPTRASAVTPGASSTTATGSPSTHPLLEVTPSMLPAPASSRGLGRSFNDFYDAPRSRPQQGASTLSISQQHKVSRDEALEEASSFMAALVDQLSPADIADAVKRDEAGEAVAVEHDFAAEYWDQVNAPGYDDDDD